MGRKKISTSSSKVEARETFGSGAQRSPLYDVRFDLICPTGERRLAARYDLGARHYGERNWQKGIPESNIINHLKNHLNLYEQGDRSDDHLAAIAWATFALMHFEDNCNCGEEE